MKKYIFYFLAMCFLLYGCNSDPLDFVHNESIPDLESTQVVFDSTENITIPSIDENIFEPTSSVETEPPTVCIPVASEIVNGFSVFYKNWNCTDILSDENHYSKMSISNLEQVHVTSDTPFGAVYIEWDMIPGEFILEWESGELVCGKEGFLHDYIMLPEEVNQINISFADDAYRLLCDIRVFTFGSAPDGIQDWQAPCVNADILVFPTHSDDETLFFGPLIAHYAIERQLTVQTAFMVNHAGYPERSHERLNALWAFGITQFLVVHRIPIP